LVALFHLAWSVKFGVEVKCGQWSFLCISYCHYKRSQHMGRE